MKLTYNDLTDTRTVPFKMLEKLDAEKKFWKNARRECGN